MTELAERLEALLGKNINQICPNGFHDAGLNHCAHFVGHVLGLRSPYTCAQFTGGRKEPANIRVHETFAQCSRVGHWKDADLSRPQMCFVTRRDVVDIERKTMANIPQKHIGVFCGGMVYHYSNGRDKVVKQKPADFLTTFDGIYSGTQALFFGYPADDNLTLKVKPTTEVGPATVKAFELLGPAGKDWSARLRGESEAFYVGRQTIDSANGYFGIFSPASKLYGPVYSGADYEATTGHWAYLLEATGWCESQNRFNMVNTYDRAKFTFGFYQLAAHTPRDNLILLFRALFADPEMAAYFPELRLMDGRLHRVDAASGATDLETEFSEAGSTQLQFFMNYLNPQRRVLDPQEILHSARLIHWANTRKTMRDIQVRVAADILQKKMSERYQPWFDLDGRSDVICLAVADVMHQGRGGAQGKTIVRKALASSDPLAALLEIGAARYPQRVKDLGTVIKRLEQAGKLGGKTYSAAGNDFV